VETSSPLRLPVLFLALLASVALADPLAFERPVVSQPAKYLPLEVEYAQVSRLANVYGSLEDAKADRVAQQHGGKSTWVSVRAQAEVEGRTFYHVGWDWSAGGWMAEGDLSFDQRLSGLRGVSLRERPGETLAMVYVLALNVRFEPGQLAEESKVGQLRAYDLVSVKETRAVDGGLWYRIGEEQWVHSGYVRTFSPRLRPEGVGEDEKWIDVNLSEQTVIAMEGDVPVYAALAATGRPGFETVTGLYRIWIKLRSAPMRGSSLVYSYADMPWVMYFSGSYGLHGVYHHDGFGVARSAGCVNLSVYDAHWFFNWSEPNMAPGERQRRSDEDAPGTWVYVSY
jgi:hypothetical protein